MNNLRCKLEYAQLAAQVTRRHRQVSEVHPVASSGHPVFSTWEYRKDKNEFCLFLPDVVGFESIG